MSDDFRRKFKDVPAPVLREAATSLMGIAEDIERLAKQQQARIDERQRTRGYKRRVENACLELGKLLDDGMDIIPATTQAAFSYNIDPKELKILWPVYRPRWLRAKEMARVRAIMAMWQNATPIDVIAKQFNISARTVNRIVRDVRDGKLRF